MELKKEPKQKKPVVSPAIEIFINWLFEHYEFRMNELSLQPEYKLIGENEFTAIDDRVYNSIDIKACKAGFKSSMINKIRAIIISDQTPLVNEIKDYFNNLKNTKTTTIKDNIIIAPTIRQYFDMITLNDEKDKDIENYWNIFVRYMISCVNSALKIKHNDVMLMLSGAQGTMKTSYLNFLTPSNLGRSKYLISGHIDPILTNVNTSNALCEKFFINIDDQMEVIFGQAYNSMKAIISIDQVTSRKTYARFEKTRKRIANFLGSVNGAEFLTDSTNRRYFVIDIESIDKKYIKINMDKFWSEAYQLSKLIKPFEVYGKDTYKSIITIANDFVEESLEMILINDYFRTEQNETYNSRVFMTTGEILTKLQEFQSRNLFMYKISNELKRSNFTYTSKRMKRFVNPKKGYVLFIKNSEALNSFSKYVF